jgi:hypothetical protein
VRVSNQLVNRRAVVVHDYVAQYPHPIVASRGTAVLIERDDAEFPGWWWCRAPDGQAGWVPTELLDAPVAPGGYSTLLDDYSAHELTVAAETLIDVMEERAGWVRACADSETVGWLPLSHVRFIAPAT